jgi:hypothetical protein
MTTVEVLARSKFAQFEECNLLLSNFLSEEGYPHDYALYEGIDHISKKRKWGKIVWGRDIVYKNSSF